MKKYEVVLRNLATGQQVMRNVEGGSEEVALCKAMNMWAHGAPKPIRLAQYMAGALDRKPPNQEFQLISIARVDDPFARPPKTRSPQTLNEDDAHFDRFMVPRE